MTGFDRNVDFDLADDSDHWKIVWEADCSSVELIGLEIYTLRSPVYCVHTSLNYVAPPTFTHSDDETRERKPM
ncbi:Uncharacterized protein HZ326_5077 [Fusarium oxysporum f. sp. albedinis]|nr:Uncharacterized protein HZ326_5077 [Fusarium oxysporum f. sp. albedinis]